MNILLTTLCFILTMMVLPFLLPIVLVLWLWKRYESKMTFQDPKGLGEICDPSDAQYYMKSPENRTSIITILIWVRGDPDIEKLRDEISRKLVFARDENGEKMFPKATRYVAFRKGTPVWVEENNFDIKDHVFIWDKSSPKNDKELGDLVGCLTYEPFPEQTSRWQFIVIEGWSPEDGSKDERINYILVRVHHSYGDGSFWQGFFNENFTKSPPKTLSKMSFATENQFFKIVKSIFTAPSILLQSYLLPVDINNLFDSCDSNDRFVVWTKDLDLELIKKIKNAAGVTVNYVLTACVAGSVREFYRAHAFRVPKDTRCLVPVNIRKPGTRLVMDNQVSGLILSLPTHTDDLKEILQETKRRMDLLKSSAEHIVINVAHKVLSAILPQTILKTMVQGYWDKVNVAFNNMPFNNEEVFFADKPVIKAINFLIPGKNPYSLKVSVMSYRDTVTMGVLLDKATYKNPSLLATSFEEKLHQLAQEFNVL